MFGYLLQFVHQPRQTSKSFQVAASLVGHADQSVKGVVHALIEVRGRSEGRSERAKVTGLYRTYEWR